MKEKYQLENPNNARVYIDYRKKDKVRFEYVGKQGTFWIIFQAILGMWITKYLWFAFFPTIITIFAVYPDIGVNLIFVYFFGTPFIISLIFYFNKRLLRLIPHINYWTGGNVYKAEFNPKDVKNKKITIPLFKNVGLDYKATEEMSKYLVRMEIIEHPFDRFLKWKRKPQEFLWRADFYFSNKPKTGKLDVIFK